MSCYEWSVDWFKDSRHVRVKWREYVQAARAYGWSERDICAAFVKMGRNDSRWSKNQLNAARKWVKERMP